MAKGCFQVKMYSIIVYDFIFFCTHTHTFVPQKLKQSDPGLTRSKVECVCHVHMCVVSHIYLIFTFFFLFLLLVGNWGTYKGRGIAPNSSKDC